MKTNFITRNKSLFLASLILFSFTFSKCGGSSYIPNHSYQGTAAGNSNFAATLLWTVNMDYNSENVTGVFDPIGSAESISLRGDLTQSGILTASGGGYTFSGSVNNGVLSGTFSGPYQGSFSSLDSTENTIIQLCGSFSGSRSGTWTLQNSNNHQTTASANSTDNSFSVNYSGTFSDNTFTLSNTSGASISGTQTGSSIAGSWNDGSGASGTFTVSREACE